jgi:hypothetical protein
MSLGVSESVVLLIFSVFWIVPLAAGVWALLTLHRIRATQEQVIRRLDAIERQGQRGTVAR